jgi:hypothetical protein
MNDKKKKRRLIILAAILLIAAVAVWANWDTISLLKYYNRDEQTVLEEKRENQKAEEIIRNKYKVPDTGLTEEDEKQLQEGTTTADAIAEKLLDSKQTSGKPEGESKEQIQKLLTELYVLQGSYSSGVDGVLQSCINEYRSLDPSQQTKASKARIVSESIGTLSSMEKQCDAQVADIVSQLGKYDQSLAQQVQSQYQSEKATKKAEVLNRYS